MIVRLLGEGQWRVDDSIIGELNSIDREVEAAVAENDQHRLTDALSRLLHTVRDSGEPVAVDALVDSDLILPDESASIEEVYAWLNDGPGEGLVPDKPARKASDHTIHVD